uniref:hypothetical protein n=1 Tax=Flavobacterium sp. TaxID=239 RepID=UPI0040495AE0
MSWFFLLKIFRNNNNITSNHFLQGSQALVIAVEILFEAFSASKRLVTKSTTSHCFLRYQSQETDWERPKK